MLRTCLRIMCKKYALKFILYSKYYNEKILEKLRNKNIFAIFYSKQWFVIRCKKLKADHSARYAETACESYVEPNV